MVDICRWHFDNSFGNGDWSHERHEIHVSGGRNELCGYRKLLDGTFCCDTCNVSKCPDDQCDHGIERIAVGGVY